MEYNPISAFLVIPVAVAVALAIHSWGDRFGARTRIFFAFIITLGLWSATEGLIQASSTLFLKVIFLKIQFLAVPTLPVWWLMVIMRYTGRERHVNNRNIGLLMIIPLFITVMTATNELHHLVYTSISLDLTHSFTRIVLVRGPIFWFNISYSYCLIALSFVFLLSRLWHQQRIYRIQAGYLMTALIFVIATNLVYLLDLFPMEHLDPLPFAFTIAAIIMAVGILKYRVLDLVPVARGQVMESISEAFVVIDSSGRLIDYNGPAASMFHWQNPRIGQPVKEIWNDRSDILDYLASDKTPGEMILVSHEEDVTKYHHVTSVPISDKTTQSAGLIFVFHDITKLKQAESELMSSLEKEKELRKTLEIETRKRIDFSRTLVHELKTPITPILSSSELLTMGMKEEPWASIAVNINRGAENMSQRIDELLDLTKGEIGTLQIVKKPVGVPEILTEIVSEMAPLAAERQQSLVFEVSDELPIIMADEVRLRQIVQNLITNAFKFSGGNGTITVTAGLDTDSIVVQVRDNGMGLTPEEQSRLFKPYERLDATQRRLGGLGLGLALCKNLVELHGGCIWVESNKGQGSTFSFSLPVQD